MQRLVIALGAALVVCLVVIAFLLGRLSAPPSTHAPVAEQVPPVVAKAPIAAVEKTPVAAVEKTPVAEPAADIRVEKYFDHIRQFQALAGGGDPQSYATRLMAGAAEGDTSGFDELLKSLDTATGMLDEIEVPPRCEEYHRALRALAQESRELVKGMRDALATKNLDQLSFVATKAQVIQEKVETLERLEKAIRAGN